MKKLKTKIIKDVTYENYEDGTKSEHTKISIPELNLVKQISLWGTPENIIGEGTHTTEEIIELTIHTTKRYIIWEKGVGTEGQNLKRLKEYHPNYDKITYYYYYKIINPNGFTLYNNSFYYCSDEYIL